MSKAAGEASSPASPGLLASGRSTGPPPSIPDHELLQVVGHGAYGEVWLARNLPMNAQRAVKVIRRMEFEDERPCQREFEGLLKYEPVSRSHPGLVHVLHVGRNEAEGFFYYVMELADAAPQANGQSPGTDGYVPRTLRCDLKTRGHLPVGECLALGRQLASALRHLHEHGLVHRDIKPSNIIFVNGQAKLADIGLVTAADATLSCVGTEGYIPPEGPGGPQGDLYSLGKTLYEAATGLDRRQFPELPADLGQWPERKELLQVNEVLVKACATDPKRRYRAAAEVERDLERLEAGRSLHWRRGSEQVARAARRAVPIALTAAVVMGLAFAAWHRPRGISQAAGVAASKAVFVLPFRSANPDAATEEIAGRVTDGLIDSLGIILGREKVGPRKSGWGLKSEEEALRLAFANFGPQEVLAGRLALTNSQALIVLSAYGAQGKPSAWSETWVASTNDLMNLERAVVQRVANRLGVKIPDPVSAQVLGVLSNNVAALEWCRKGGQLMASFSVLRLALAKEAFQHATELDPNYCEAHFGVLFVHRVSYDKPYRDVWPDLRSCARTILQIDDTHWGARYHLAFARMIHDYDWEHGMPEFETVLREQPNNGLEWAIYYRMIGRLDQARVAQKQQDGINVRGGSPLWHSVVAKYLDGRFEEAVQGGRKIQQVDPESHIGYLLEAWALIGLRDYPAAVQAIQQGLQLHPRHDLRALLGYVYARMGETAKAAGVLEELNKLPYAQPYWVARLHAALGNSKEALDWLEKACEDRSELLVQADIGMGGLRRDEAWEGIRSEPRFLELLRKTGLDKWPK